MIAASVLGLLLQSTVALANGHVRTGATVNVTLTTRSLSRALTPMPDVRFTSVPSWRPTLHVDEAMRYQRMLGFGAAMTDSSAWLLQDELTSRVRSRVLRSLFSPTRGIGLKFIRVPMGASDFSATGVPYTYDDLPPGMTDPSLARFSIAHDEAYILPALRAALAAGHAIDVLATEWSPPAWMKTNDSLQSSGGPEYLQPSYRETLALYFAKFILGYQSQGIPIWGVTPQNEPNAAPAYPGMMFPAADEASFIRSDLEPTLAAYGLDPRIYGVDDGYALAYALAFMQAGPGSDLAGIAWHCYGGQQVIGEFHASYPTITNIMSECSPGIIPYSASEAAISGTRNWASAVLLWNLALDPRGGPVEPPNAGCPHCSGLVTVDETTHRARYERSYYQLGQLSKFVQPGAVRIGTERWVSEFGTGLARPFGVTSGLDNVAFKNPDGTLVLVAYDNSRRPIRFAVAWRGKRFGYRLPAWATVTFTWR